jgi:hypothetical protein
MSGWEIFFALIGLALVFIPWALTAQNVPVPRLVARCMLWVGIMIAVLAIAIPVYRWIFTPITYIYLFPGRGLGEASAQAPHDFTMRRVFVLERSGPEILQNVEVTLRDYKAAGQVTTDHVETYAEVGPDASSSGASQPKHFWFAPSKPWDEDYTVTLKSGEKVFIERIVVIGISPPPIPGTPINPPPAPKVTPTLLGVPLGPEMGRVALAIRVTSYGDDSPVFTCRDADLAHLPEWTHDTFQPCSEHSTDTSGFEFFLDPKPFVLAFPGRILDMTPPAVPQLSSHPETEPSNRELSGWQKAHMVKILEKFPGKRVLIVATDDDATRRYAKDFRDVFQQSHWIVKGPVDAPKTDCTPVDVTLQVWKDDLGGPRPHVVAAEDALKAAGVKGGRHYECVLASSRSLVLRVGVKSPDEVNDDDIPACPPRVSPEIDALVARF